jgi:hypothetical protein
VRYAFACLLLAPSLAAAGEVLESSVTRNGAFYRVWISARIDAPLAVVYAAITDYEHLAAINPNIVESRVLESASPGRDRVYSAMHVCILVFCKRVVQVQDVELRDNRSILAITRPQDSDFRSGVARWRFTEEGASTLMRFNQEFEPDFWVPPVIGPWLIERKLVEEVTVSARYIEGLARRPAAQ